MQKSTLFTLASAALLALVSCGGESQPSSSSTSTPSTDSSVSSSEPLPQGEKLTVNVAATLLESLAQKETESSSRANVKTVTPINESKTTREESHTLYKDGSSSYEGKVSKGEKVDAFQGRKLQREDTFLSNGVASKKNRLYWAEKHENSFAIDQETSCRIYEVLEDGQESSSPYIPASSASFTLTAMVSGSVHDFLASVASDVNLQSAMPYFYKTESEGTSYYDFNASYSYSGDLGDTVQIDYEIHFSVKDDVLVSGSYISGMTDSRGNEDPYIKSTSYEGSLSYGERSSFPIEGLLDVNSFLLSSVSDIQIHSSGNGGDIVKGNISKNSYYVSASPKTYLPETALTGLLAPISSTDESVLKVGNGYAIEVKGKTGSATITFAYEGRNEDGVFEKKTIQKELIVSGVAPKEFKVTEDELIVGSTLVVGESYETSLTLSSGSDSTLEVTSSDPEAVAVSLNNKGNLVMEAKKATASVTVTVTPVAAPDLAKTFTYKVEEKKNSQEMLLAHYFKYTNHLVIGTNYVFYELHFNKDGSGYRLQSFKESPKTYTDKFTWSMEGDRVSFAWDKDAEGHLYEYAKIYGNGRSLLCFETDSSDESSSTPNDTLYRGVAL